MINKRLIVYPLERRITLLITAYLSSLCPETKAMCIVKIKVTRKKLRKLCYSSPFAKPVNFEHPTKGVVTL
jgi:hypothetical protein